MYRDKTPVSNLEIDEVSHTVIKPSPLRNRGMQQGIGCSRVNIYPDRVPHLTQFDPYGDERCESSLHGFIAKDLRWHRRPISLQDGVEVFDTRDTED